MDAAAAIAKATVGTQWECRLWMVGGAVRDELLGLPPPPDIDLVLESDALELASFLFEKRVSTIKPVTYPRFGTALLRVHGAPVELVTARRESYDEESRKPHVLAATLRDDALRRDFTINTLLKNLHTAEMRDPLGTGMADLRGGILRTPVDPSATFHDDPLRMLRAIRFKNRFRFAFAPGLLQSIQTEAERLRIISGERIRDELVKMLLHPTAADSLGDLMGSGLLPVFAPEFSEGIGMEQGSYHTKDVWEHTLDVVAQACNGFSPDAFHAASETGEELMVVLGSLFHDVAKPRTRTADPDGRIRFFGHERIGARMTAETMRRLRFGRKTGANVAALVRNHMRLGSAIPFTHAAARRVTRDMGPLLEPLLRLCEADAAALRTLPKGIDFADVRAKLAQVKVPESPKFDSPLNGDEIMELLKIPPGPEVSKWKKRLTEAVLDGKIEAADKQAAKKLLEKWVSRSS